MTLAETWQIYTIITAAYPAFFRNNAQAKSWVSVWHEVLKDIPYTDVSTGLTMYLRDSTTGYPPAPGQIMERIKILHPTEDDLATPAAAWDLVVKAASRSGYSAQEEYDKLPPLIQETIHSPAYLKELAFDESFYEHQSYYEAAFIRSYEQAKSRHDRESSYSTDTQLKIAEARQQAASRLPSGVKAIASAQGTDAEVAEHMVKASKREAGEKVTDEEIRALVQQLADSLGADDKNS